MKERRGGSISNVLYFNNEGTNERDANRQNRIQSRFSYYKTTKALNTKCRYENMSFGI